jgi:hypothetical protein
VLAPFGSGYTGPLSVALGAVNRDAVADIAVAQGAGSAGAVKVLDGKTGKALASYYPFRASFRGGATVALGDVNADGRADVVVGSGPGATAQVKVYDSATRRPAGTLIPFARSFHGGISVAARDLNGDRRAELVVGSGPGMPATVQVFDGATSTLQDSFAPFAPTVRGGVSVAVVPLGGKPYVVTGSGPGTTAVVRGFAAGTHDPAWSFDAFASTFTGGAVPAAGPGGTLLVAAGAGGGAQVKVLDGTTDDLVATFLGAPGQGAIGVAAG